MAMQHSFPDPKTPVEGVGSVGYGTLWWIVVCKQIWQVAAQTEIGSPGANMNKLARMRVFFFEPAMVGGIPGVEVSGQLRLGGRGQSEGDGSQLAGGQQRRTAG